MKKQLIALGLASILTVPSVVLAEATWYGSFRGIVHGQGGETSMMSNGSRWGVKGSSEVSEGLTAVYRYEENLNLATATLGAGNRLSYVGLSGGFGTITLGQIWSASYNHVGVLTDNGVWSGNQSLTGRTGSTVSYSASTGPVSFQIDAQMNSGTARSVDTAQLGMSFDTGAATVGLAFVDQNTASGKTKKSAIGFSIPVGGLTVYASHTGKTEQKDAVSAVNSAIRCHTFTTKNRRWVKTSDVLVESPSLKCVDHDPKLKDSKADDNTDGRVNVAEVLLAGRKAVVASTTRTKSVHAGVSGTLGDTGMSFAVNFADHSAKSASGDGENPWNVNVGKSLGGGASLAFEYIDNDSEKTKNEALVQLRVDF